MKAKENKIEQALKCACDKGLEYYKSKSSFKEAWEQCPRGDWMLWFAKKVNVNIHTLTLAKALCATTVRHLMKDKKSTNAILVAIKFGREKATIEELNAAAAAAAAAAYAATDATTDATTDAANAADAAAKTKNQLKTADICRKILTNDIYKILCIKH